MRCMAIRYFYLNHSMASHVELERFMQPSEADKLTLCSTRILAYQTISTT